MPGSHSLPALNDRAKDFIVTKFMIEIGQIKFQVIFVFDLVNQGRNNLSLYLLSGL
jgi:hypothetical protein